MPVFDTVSHETNLYQGSPGTTQYKGQSSMEGTDHKCPKI